MAEKFSLGFRSPRRRRSAKNRIALSPLDSNKGDCSEYSRDPRKALKSCSTELGDEMQRLFDEIKQCRASIEEHREHVFSLSESLEQRNAFQLPTTDPDPLYKRIENELAGLKQITHSEIGSLSKQMNQTNRTCESRIDELIQRVSRMEGSLAQTLDLVLCHTPGEYENNDIHSLSKSKSVCIGEWNSSCSKKITQEPEKKLDDLSESKENGDIENGANPLQKKQVSGIISHWAAVSRFLSLSQ